MLRYWYNQFNPKHTILFKVINNTMIFFDDLTDNLVSETVCRRIGFCCFQFFVGLKNGTTHGVFAKNDAIVVLNVE